MIRNLVLSGKEADLIYFFFRGMKGSEPLSHPIDEWSVTIQVDDENVEESRGDGEFWCGEDAVLGFCVFVSDVFCSAVFVRQANEDGLYKFSTFGKPRFLK